MTLADRLNLRMLISRLREFKEIRELNPIIINNTKNRINEKGVTPFTEVTPHFQKHFLI